MKQQDTLLILFNLFAVFSFGITKKNSCYEYCKIATAYQEINPVCGSDNLTYVNREILDCRNKCEGLSIEEIDDKPCQCICFNTKELMPVCASNGETYNNKGAVRCYNTCNYEKITILYASECLKKT